jgi:hypothetical protein
MYLKRKVSASHQLFFKLQVNKRGQYENCTLLGYYAASSGNFLPTFWDNLPVPSSGLTLTNMLFWNVCKKLPLLAAQWPIKRSFHLHSRNVCKKLPLLAAQWPIKRSFHLHSSKVWVSENEFFHASDRKLGGPHSRYGPKTKIVCVVTLPHIEIQSLRPPIRSLATKPTAPSRCQTTTQVC